MKLIIGDSVPIASANTSQPASFLLIKSIANTIFIRLADSNRSAIESKTAPICEQEPVFRAIVPSIMSVNSATVYIIRNKTEIFLKKINKINAKSILDTVNTLAMCFICLMMSFRSDKYVFNGFFKFYSPQTKCLVIFKHIYSTVYKINRQ